MKNKILLHCCCAVCASHCIEKLQSLDYDVVLFFSNSNIDTETEFEKRLNEVKKLSKIYNLQLFIDPYNHQMFLDEIKGYEGQPERGKRCNLCFSLNFSQASDAANELGIPFTTSLSISPHKDVDMIKNEGARFDNFEFFNFKKQNGFGEALNLAKNYNLYKQNYCGCEFSKPKDEK